MKKVFKLLGFVCLFIAFTTIFESCSDEQIYIKELDSKVDAITIKSLLESRQQGIPFPKGSKVFKLATNTYEIRLPENYFYLGTSERTDGVLVSELVGSVSITCTCTKGSGCSPAFALNQYFCLMNEDCKSCDMKITHASSARNSKASFSIKGLINKNAGITALSKTSLPPKSNPREIRLLNDLDVIHGNVFDELFKMDEVDDYFSGMADYFKANNLKPNSYMYLNIYGNLALVPFYDVYKPTIEINDVKFEALTLDDDEAYKITCNCEVGSGCEKKSYYIIGVGKVIYCEAGANFTKCTLTNSNS
jgi:hypothetical protein